MRTGIFIIKYRWLIIALSLLVSGFFGFQIFRAEINPDLESYIYDKMPSRINTNLIEEIFGGDEMVMILFETDDVLNKETLSRVKKVNEQVKDIQGIDQTLSLFDAKSIKGENGFMVVDPAIGRFPVTKPGWAALRKELKENELVHKILISEDFTMTSIIATLESEARDEEIVDAIEKILVEIPGKETTYIGGLPYMKAVMSREMAHEFRLLMGIGLGIMLLMLLVFFREARGVLLPFVVVVLSILFAMGLMPLAGWQMSMITLLLPIMMIAIANDYGIHMMAKYQEYNVTGNHSSVGSIARGVYTSLRTPILFTGITTIAGILCLLSHKMIPAKQLGVVAAAGIGYALLLSLLLIPAALSVMGKSKPVLTEHLSGRHFMDRILASTGRMVNRRPGRVILVSTLVMLLSGGGVWLLKVDTDLENFFPAKHPARVSARVIDETFGGSQNISILVEGDILDPEVMGQIDRYETELKKHPAVGHVISIAGIIREISKALNDRGDPYYNVIPDDRNALAQYLELYLMSGDPGDLEKLVDFDFRRAQVMVRVNDGSNSALKSVLKEIRQLSGPAVTRIGGYGLISADLADLVVRGQITSLAIALLVVILLLAILFRSVPAGLISALPLAFSMVILFGWMGYLDVKLDIATALLSSIMIGVGVDYTIHFLWRYKSERESGLVPADAVLKTLTTTGRGISFNALSVILGFCALPFSVFLPIRIFGFLVMVSIFSCLVGAIVIVPALVLIFKPAFLEPGRRKIRIPLGELTGWLRGRKTIPANQ
jgi:hydrophobe/amphiphile efflux-3 (HAE3) family protein